MLPSASRCLSTCLTRWLDVWIRAKQAVDRSGLAVATTQRLSWHSLRHSSGSVLLTELELPITTVARALGHANPSTTLKTYTRDQRDEDAFIQSILDRSMATGVGVAA